MCVQHMPVNDLPLSQEHVVLLSTIIIHHFFYIFLLILKKIGGPISSYQRMDSRMREMPDGNPWAEKLGREAMDRIIRRKC